MSIRRLIKIQVALLLTLGLAGTLVLSASKRPQGGSSRANPILTAPEVPAHVPGEVLVKFRDGVGPAKKTQTRAVLAAENKGRLLGGSERWKLGAGRTTEDAIAELRRDPDVLYAEPNYLVHAVQTVPDDPGFVQQWALRNTGQDDGTPDADIDADLAWDVSTGSSAVLVAIIDSGIQWDHPDLVDNIWSPGPQAPHCSEADPDIPDQPVTAAGCDFVNDDNDAMDDNKHGTHVAGIVGATADNGLGVSGVNWDVSLLPLKFLDGGGTGPGSEAIRAIEYAVLAGADVINNSWGSFGYSQAIRDAIFEAGAAGVLVVSAAGNNGIDTDVLPFYPATYATPNHLAVAATDREDTLAGFSNFGGGTIHLGAPGVSILSTTPTSFTNGYDSFSGTSMASPHVAGAAALVFSMRPGLTAEGVMRILLDNVDPVPALQGKTISGGRLNVAVPIDTVAPGAVNDLAVVSPTSNTAILTWTATGDDGATGTALHYDLRYSIQPIDASNFDQAAQAQGLSPALPSGSTETAEVFGLAPTLTYHFALRVLDEWANPGPISNVVSTTTLESPRLSASPDSFDVSVSFGETAGDTLLIDNVGPAESTLDWSIELPVLDLDLDFDEFIPEPGICEIELGFTCPSDALAVPPALDPPSEFVVANPISGRVYGGSSESATLSFGGALLPDGLYEGDLVLQTNDPLAPSELFPLTLQVVPRPKLRFGLQVDAAVVLEGEEVQLGSCADPNNGLTTHALPAPLLPAAGEGGTVEMGVIGDYCFTNQTATLRAEGQVLGSVSGTGDPNGQFFCIGGAECFGRIFVLGETLLNQLLADAEAGFTIQDSSQVGNSSFSEHAVRLKYRPSFDSIDFGTEAGSILSLAVHNSGSGVALNATISSDDTTFLVTPESVVVQPGETALVEVGFYPLDPGTYQAVLTIASDDPDRPAVDVVVYGSASVAAPPPCPTESTCRGGDTCDLGCEANGTPTGTILNPQACTQPGGQVLTCGENELLVRQEIPCGACACCDEQPACVCSLTASCGVSVQNICVPFVDADGDGYPADPAPPLDLAADCDDANPAINPGAVEVCGDGIDNNCGGSDCGPNLIANGDFSAGIANWNLSCAQSAWTVTDGVAQVLTANAPGFCQLYQYGLDLLPSTTYELVFDARHESGANIGALRLLRHTSPYNTAATPDVNVDTTTEMQTFRYTFDTAGTTSCPGSSGCRFRFELHAYDVANQSYYFDNVQLCEGSCFQQACTEDTDGDGTLDCDDACPNDPAKVAPGACGCGLADTDSDADGTPDCQDGCPADPAKVAPGDCGCGSPDVDADGDGLAACLDCDDQEAACTTDCTDADGDGWRVCDGDCDDGQSGTNPGATDVCDNGIDEDCSGSDCTTGSSNLLTNGDFAQGKTGWSLSCTDASWVITGGQAKVTTANAPGFCQLYQYNLDLTPGATYELRFDARHDSGANIGAVRTLQHFSPYTTTATPAANINTTNQMATFSYTFNTAGSVTCDGAGGCRFRFELHTYDVAGESYYFDNVELCEGNCP